MIKSFATSLFLTSAFLTRSASASMIFRSFSSSRLSPGLVFTSSKASKVSSSSNDVIASSSPSASDSSYSRPLPNSYTSAEHRTLFRQIVAAPGALSSDVQSLRQCIMEMMAKGRQDSAMVVIDALTAVRAADQAIAAAKSVMEENNNYKHNSVKSSQAQTSASKSKQQVPIQNTSASLSSASSGRVQIPIKNLNRSSATHKSLSITDPSYVPPGFVDPFSPPSSPITTSSSASPSSKKQKAADLFQAKSEMMTALKDRDNLPAIERAHDRLVELGLKPSPDILFYLLAGYCDAADLRSVRRLLWRLDAIRFAMDVESLKFLVSGLLARGQTQIAMEMMDFVTNLNLWKSAAKQAMKTEATAAATDNKSSKKGH